jgi:acyl-coenzyme A synthetase/AMP-(fatty) acid ligase
MFKVPALIEMILKVRNIAIGYDLTSVDNIVSGAAPLPEKTAEALQRFLPKCRIRQGYGELHRSAPFVFLLMLD